MTIDWEAFTNRTVTTAEVRLLGIVDVAALLALQKLMVHEVRCQSRTNLAILMCEHPPSITTGTQSSLLELPCDPRELESRLIVVHRVKRDGHAILHSTGQLVVCIVASLPECGMDEDQYRQHLQESIRLTCFDQQVSVCGRAGDPGVTVGRHGLVAESAIRIEDGITSFGIFLNVSNRLDEQRQFGRGLLGERISSLNAERVRPTQMSQVRASLMRHLCEQLGYPEYHIHTGHPFLKRIGVRVYDQSSDH